MRQVVCRAAQSEELIMPKQLSEHFTLEEMTHSQTAARQGMDNTLAPDVVQNLKALCVSILEPVCALVEQQQLFISS